MATIDEFELQKQQLNRQQRMAEMLLAQGQQMSQGPAGQMVSGQYVQNSPLQMLNAPVNQLVGAWLSSKGDEKSAKLAQQLRDAEVGAVTNWMETTKGRAATPEVRTEMAGPYGANMGETGGLNVPKPEAVMPARAAIAANPEAANMAALLSPSAPAWLKQSAGKKLTEGPKWQTVSQYNEKTGNTENYRYNENSPNPRETLQFIGIAKPAISRAEELRLNDDGIGTGMPSAGGGVRNVGGGAPMGNAPMGGGTMPAVKPASSATQNDLVKTYGYDPFKEPTPPSLPNKDIRQWRADLYKPLSGTAGDQVTGAKLYYDTLTKYNNYVDGLTASDLASPSVRQMLTSLHAQVKLTGKEANKLGVLNGGDERILDEVIPNYKDILVTKENLKKMISNQQEFGSNIIVNAYGTQQKPVPETMRKYVVVPKADQPSTAKPKATGATARAVLNGRQIEVRGGKWVDSSTGQEVK